MKKLRIIALLAAIALALGFASCSSPSSSSGGNNNTGDYESYVPWLFLSDNSESIPEDSWIDFLELKKDLEARGVKFQRVEDGYKVEYTLSEWYELLEELDI